MKTGPSAEEFIKWKSNNRFPSLKADSTIITKVITTPSETTLNSEQKDEPESSQNSDIQSEERDELNPDKQRISSQQENSTYPSIDNPNRLTKEDVRDLARFYGLFTRWKVNPQLRFQEGDISYWYEQKRSEQELKVEFESRKIVLERAEKHGNCIETQGDLSYYAEQAQSEMKWR